MSSKGLTLIELMIVLAVLAVLLVVGAPAMTKLRYSILAEGAVQGLMTSIVFTRSEAIRRNQRVSMCPSQMAQTGEAICSGIYARGWIVFANPDGDRSVDQGDEVIRIYGPLPEGLTLTNRAGTRDASELLSYKPDGSSGRTRTLLVCAPPQLGVPPRSVVMSNVGRPRLARGWGTCPAG